MTARPFPGPTHRILFPALAVGLPIYVGPDRLGWTARAWLEGEPTVCLDDAGMALFCEPDGTPDPHAKPLTLEMI